MGHISFLCAALLVFFCPKQGSSAVTPLFVEKGKDAFLKVLETDVPAEFTLLIWKVNDSDVLVAFGSNKEPEVAGKYSGRIDVKNFSLTLKNLQEADSGVYIARLTVKTKENILAGYNVTVQNPVSPVELTVENMYQSAELCVVTVTCSTQDSCHINASFRCDTETCSQEDGGLRTVSTTWGTSLQLYLSNDLTITCNHSNQVSLKRNMTRIEDFCPLHADSASSYLYIAVIVVVATVTITTIFTAVYIYHRKKRKRRESAENTVYAFTQGPNASPNGTEATAGTGDESVSSMYAQVQHLPKS
ncbi:CD48 antigen-like [Solea senegalensis]|nr:CD48 antigen-like [Solea senegalensis]